MAALTQHSATSGELPTAPQLAAVIATTLRQAGLVNESDQTPLSRRQQVALQREIIATMRRAWNDPFIRVTVVNAL